MQIQNFTKIRPVGAELFYADGQTGRHNETKIAFAILATRLKIILHRARFYTNRSIGSNVEREKEIGLTLLRISRKYQQGQLVAQRDSYWVPLENKSYVINTCPRMFRVAME